MGCTSYHSFGLRLPEGEFLHTPSLEHVSVNKEQWRDMLQTMKPLSKAVSAIPVTALRTDIGGLISTRKYLSNFLKINPLDTMKLTTSFHTVLDKAGVTDSFTRNWLDLLCFCLSGLPAEGTITAEMAMMLGEFYEEDAIMDCPVGGARAIVDALVRGIEKHGGTVLTNTHVDKILVEQGKAGGVLTKGNKILAKKAVISNLSVWDLYKSDLVKNELPKTYVEQRLATPIGKSFMHLHLGFRITREELSKLQAHYLCIEDWSRGVDAEDNAVLISIPSVHDPTVAPEGYAVLHAYTPATEDFKKWCVLNYKSPEYKQLKEERSQYLWKVVEKIIPDIRTRSTIVKVGTPLTHRRFLNRYQGSYGPAINAETSSFPFPSTPIQGLFTCGDSVFPGIGAPAVAGSGILAANSVSSLEPQLKYLQQLRTE